MARHRTGRWRHIIAPDYELTETTRVELLAVPPETAGHYKHLWIHRIKAGRAPCNVAVLLDGQVAAVMGWDYSTITVPFEGAVSRGAILYVYGAAPLHTLRLGRLASALAITRPTISVAVSDLFADGAEQVSTIVMSPHPEAKHLRGLMKLAQRRPDKKAGGFRLTYLADIGEDSPEEVYRRWLAQERRRSNASTSAKGSELAA